MGVIVIARSSISWFPSLIFSPISKFLVSSTSIIDKKVTKKMDAMSVDELEHALDLTKDSVETEEEKSDDEENSFDLDDT